MVESAHSAGGQSEPWWPSVYGPLRGLGQRIADFFSPSADAAATPEAYEISVELPGVSADQIDVSIKDRTVTIKGEKTTQRESEGKTYYFSERVYGAFQRSFRLPEDAIADHLAADFKDGVLTLKIPKTDATTETSRRIPVNYG